MSGSSCQICYENAEMLSLECSHSLCVVCLPKLQLKLCPFCRRDIRPKRPEIHIEYVEIERPITVRRRRRSNRRVSNYTLDTEYGTVLVEELEEETSPRRGASRNERFCENAHGRKGARKPKAGKNNFRKGRWAQRSCPRLYR